MKAKLLSFAIAFAICLVAAESRLSAQPKVVAQAKAIVQDLGGSFKQKKRNRNITIFLSRSKVTDEHLKIIGRLKNLFSLKIESTAITDKGFFYLKNANKLRDLWAKQTKITDAGLVHLQRLKKLEHLNISSTSVTNKGLAHLASYPKLKRLYLGGLKVNYLGIQHVTKLPLTIIDLQRTLVGFRGVNVLAKIKTLESINLSDTIVSNIAPLASLPKLQRLEINRTRVPFGAENAFRKGVVSR